MRRLISDERWEKKLPKPVYILYALCILIGIILVNVFSRKAYGTINTTATDVLSDYTDELENYQQMIK